MDYIFTLEQILTTSSVRVTVRGTKTVSVVCPRVMSHFHFVLQALYFRGSISHEDILT